MVVDLDPEGPHYPGDRTLAELVNDGPRRSDLTPRRGVAVLRNGGVTAADATKVIAALVDAHPTVVLRLPPRPTPASAAGVIPVRLLLPGGLFPVPAQPAVWQATPALARMPGVGVRLPVPRPITVESLLRGQRPPGRDRWVAAWRSVWRFPWGR